MKYVDIIINIPIKDKSILIEKTLKLAKSRKAKKK